MVASWSDRTEGREGGDFLADNRRPLVTGADASRCSAGEIRLSGTRSAVRLSTTLSAAIFAQWS